MVSNLLLKSKYKEKNRTFHSCANGITYHSVPGSVIKPGAPSLVWRGTQIIREVHEVHQSMPDIWVHAGEAVRAVAIVRYFGNVGRVVVGGNPDGEEEGFWGFFLCLPSAKINLT